MDKQTQLPDMDELLDQLLDVGESLLAQLPPDLAFQVELSLGELS